MRLSGKELYGHMEQTLWHTERTIYNTLAVAKYLMSRHVNAVDYKVVMTGEGSDELFGGYPAFRRDMFLHGLDALPDQEKTAWEELLQQSNALVQGAMLSADQVDDPDIASVVGFTPSCLQPWLACAPHVPALLAKEHRDALTGYSPGRAIADQRQSSSKAAMPLTKLSTSGSKRCWRGRSSLGVAIESIWPTPWKPARRPPPRGSGSPGSTGCASKAKLRNTSCGRRCTGSCQRFSTAAEICLHGPSSPHGTRKMGTDAQAGG